MNKLQLINPPMDKGYSHSLRTGIYPPLNLATLAGYLNLKIPTWEIELLDGEIESLENILLKLNSDLVGINANVLTYKTALIIAEHAKKKGIKVVLGGPYTNSMAKKIIRNRPFIDIVVVGDGEIPLSKIMDEDNYSNIPNIVYRDGTTVRANKSVKTDMKKFIIPNYNNLSLANYFAEFSVRYNKYKPFKASLAINSMKGCEWRDKTSGGCVFCMIPNFGVSYKKPENVWHEIEHFHELYGVESFWEVSDSFVDNAEWLKELKDTKPKDVDISLHIYGRANGINEEKAKLLKDIGVFEVFIGAESGDNGILKNSKKGITTNTTIRAIEALEKEEINVIVSFVLGLPGETKYTLQKTVDFAKKLSKYKNVYETSTSIMFPMPGSNAYNELMKVKGMLKKYDSDILDYELLKRDWLKHFTSVNMLDLEIVLEEITNNFPLNSTFAITQEKEFSALMC